MSTSTSSANHGSGSRDKPRALLALALIVPAPTVGVVSAMFLDLGTLGEVIFIACKLWMLALPIVWLRFVDREPFSLSPARRGGFGVGVALGVVISLVIGATYMLVGTKLIDPETVRAAAAENGIGTPARFLGLAAFWIFCNSVLEEYVYRWFIFRKCESTMPPVIAVLASALFFTVHHVFALKDQFGWTITLLASFGVFLGGAIWSWLYLKYRSIWPCWVSHAIVDVAIYIIGWQLIFGF